MSNLVSQSHSQEKATSLNVREVSLVDILHFLKDTWKASAVTAILGFAVSITYLALAPKKYEAIAHITMAQIRAASNNINPLGVNIEEPALLIARMSSPTSFTPSAIAACDLQDQVYGALELSKSIKLTITKGVANVVELKTFGQTSEAARACNFAVFEIIKTTQSQIIAPYIEEAKTKLANDEQRLQKAKDLVAKVDKTDSAIGAVYLSTRDEIRDLLDEITSLKNVVTSNQNRSTRLVAPIYASDEPISPKKRLVLAVGFFGGLCLGLLIALMRRVVVSINGGASGVP